MAGRIFITGDIHSDPTRIFDICTLEGLDKNDFVIVCGDFGLVWAEDEESQREKMLLDMLDEAPFTTLFVDGNHENFDRLFALPIEQWRGGEVHKVRPSVIHLCRGSLFDLEGTTVFAFGGARSHDISDGILDPDNPEDRQKIYEWSKIPTRYFRINHVTWWEQEMPNNKEFAKGFETLNNHNNEVDLIITHDCPDQILPFISPWNNNGDKLRIFLGEIANITTFDKWYFGHHHTDKIINEHFECIYDTIKEYSKDRFRFVDFLNYDER